MARGQTTPLGAVVKGAVAGIAGTLAMDLALWAQQRSAGAVEDFVSWETSAGLASFDGAPAPAQVGRRILEGYLQQELPPSAARAVNNAMHVLTGTQWGVVHGVLAGTSGRSGPFSGVRTGLLAWLSSYALLTPAGLYEPIWTYPPAVLAKDAGAHVVYGLSVAATFRLLGGARVDPG